VANLLVEGSGFFVVPALALYLANQKQADLSPTITGFTVPSASSIGVLTVLAAGARLDLITPLEMAALAGLMALLFAARLVTWHGRLPWLAQLALAGDVSTTTLALAAAAVCAARLNEFAVLPGPVVFTLVVLVVFIRLSVASVVSVFEVRGWGTASASAERARPASL